MVDDKLRILIIEARFYGAISDALLQGAGDALRAFGAEFDVVTVPGAFELPAAIALADEGGKRPAGVRYDGFVALGCVIRGETTHYDYVCGESARGLMELSINKGLAIGYGVLTVEDEAQAWARARISEGDKGGFAARACLDMVALRRRLLGVAR
ncbi:MAG: 6,7-dimethyl-8-ribityllumazine synthase [Caulobacteraceae bacterium]|jgi:6,7-dimethyl-8-ribityllumazine synthase|nr:6,7-dimethyl-8-ribityllumazine synthase [Caulobacteraceae bacterium]